MSVALKDGRLFKNTYRGIPNVGFIWNGTQSDPELAYKYKGEVYAVNYWDVEDYLDNCYREDYPEYDGKDIPDDKFNEYAVSMRNSVYGYIEDIIDMCHAGRIVSDSERYDLAWVKE